MKLFRKNIIIQIKRGLNIGYAVDILKQMQILKLKMKSTKEILKERKEKSIGLKRGFQKKTLKNQQEKNILVQIQHAIIIG